MREKWEIDYWAQRWTEDGGFILWVGKMESVLVEDDVPGDKNLATGNIKTFVPTMHVAKAEKNRLFGMKIEFVMIERTKEQKTCTTKYF